MRFSQVKSVASLSLTVALLAMSSAAFAANKNALTHDQARAEYLAARMAGTQVPHGDAPIVMQKKSPSTLSRDAVRAEFFAARATGTLVPNGDASTARAVSVSSTVTRNAVRAELAAARAAGTLSLPGERG